MSFKTKIKGPSNTRIINKIKKSAVGKPRVLVGVIDAGVHTGAGDDSPTVATIAAWNEFGNKRTPERPFFRTTLPEEKGNVKKMSRVMLKKIYKGDMKVDTGLGLIGKHMAGKIQEKIVEIKSPENADSTLARKFPRTNPLIDSGHMMRVITWKVED